MAAIDLRKSGNLTPRQLLRLVAKHEQERVEFKGASAATEELVATVVCLANGEGGLILWGVENDGTLATVRLKDPLSFKKTVYHSTSPSQLVKVQVVDVEGVQILAIWVEHSSVLVSTSKGLYLQRLGTECVPMTPERLIVRQIDTRTLDFSSALTPVTPAAADPMEVERFRQQLPTEADGPGMRELPTLDLLRAVGAVGRHDGDELLTVAGLLIFGREGDIRDTLPQHEVVFLRFASGSTAYEHRLASSGHLFGLIERLLTEIKASSRTRIISIGAQDIEVPDYPDRVIREAIVNALAHRHFTLPGHVVISQKPGFVEIENPGGFPEGITPDTVIQHAPVHRNRLLCEILDRVRFMERSGLGVDRIFEDQLRYGKLPPSYAADRTMVRLRIDSSQFDEAFARMVIGEERRDRRWNVEELLITSYLRRMGPADRATLARVVQRPEEEAQDLINGLIPDILERFGTGPTSRYALSARVQSIFGAEVKYTQERGLAREYQRSIVLQHAEKFRRVDNRTVRDLLNISISEATNLLRTLENRGQLVQHGRRRWAYYRPARAKVLAMLKVTGQASSSN